jgi:CheY-like chemotaxis protein
MDEDKTLLNQVDSASYDASDKPFDFVEAEGETALICASDPNVRERISEALKSLTYMTTEAASARDALKKMRFHTYDVVVLDERFDTDNPDQNHVLQYLEGLPMGTRRNMFVALVTERFRSMDNMAAFNKSVNLMIHTKNIDDVATILKRGVSENAAFYRVFKETLVKMGKG